MLHATYILATAMCQRWYWHAAQCCNVHCVAIDVSLACSKTPAIAQQQQQRQSCTTANDQRSLRGCAAICYAWQSVSVETKRWNDKIVATFAATVQQALNASSMYAHSRKSPLWLRLAGCNCNIPKCQIAANQKFHSSRSLKNCYNNKIVKSTTRIVKLATKNANYNRTTFGMLQLTAAATATITTMCALRVRKHNGGWLIDMRNLLASPLCCRVLPPLSSMHATHIYTFAHTR